MYKEAYSIEIDEVIDAEKAYELYWEDLINDVHDFICSEEGCTAQLTLSSVNKEWIGNPFLDKITPNKKLL